MDRRPGCGLNRGAAFACVAVLSGFALIRAYAPVHAMSVDPWEQPSPPAVLGVEGVDEPLLRFDPESSPLIDRYGASPGQTAEWILSKSLFPAEDRYLDAVLLLDPAVAEAAEGVELSLADGAGEVHYRYRLETVPGAQVFLSALIPPGLAGREGLLTADLGEHGRTSARFGVRPAAPPSASGRIALEVRHRGGAVRGVPFTVGVPFPRGALWSADPLRLVTEAGTALPLQAEVAGRWARFGPVKWVTCSFTADVPAEGARFYIEYGEPAEGARPQSIEAELAEAGFPAIRAGRLRADASGLYYDPDGAGRYHTVLDGAALRGGFVVRSGGRRYKMAPDGAHEIEEIGPARAVVRTSGYFKDADGDAFCRYQTRMFFHRDSPVIRMVHTWIFTGDGNRDQIEEMGWRFALPEGMEGEGFLASFADSALAPGRAMVQHRHDQYDLLDGGQRREDLDGRLPGVVAATDGTLRVTLGVQDFWQNFPSELAAEPGALVFYNWPRHGRAARHAPATLDDAWKLWFVHEGEALNFRLPDEYVSEPFWRAMSRERPASSHYQLGNVESANAQGIARTEEWWLAIGPADQGVGGLAQTMQGLNDATLRAVVDPAWVAASGAFHDMHPRDPAHFPEEEKVFDELARAPLRWTDRMEHYGMWVYGDMLSVFRLQSQTSTLYRTRRKGHHAWPYPWIPFARSGDADLMKMAQAATRQMIDANYCHYVSPEVEAATGERYTRGRGFWHRALIPWTGRYNPATRQYSERCTYLWHAYYLADDRRARDVALDFATATKVTEDRRDRGRLLPTAGSGRADVAILKSYAEMYQATFDPWFLVAASELARGRQVRRVGLLGGPPVTWEAMWRSTVDGLPGFRGLRHRDFWHAGDREFYRLSGCPEHAKVLIDRAWEWTFPRWTGFSHWAGSARIPQWEPAACGYFLTGDERFLRRIEHYLDMLKAGLWHGPEPPYMQGTPLHGPERVTGWSLHHFPQALAALHKAGVRLRPLPSTFPQRLHTPRPVAVGGEEMFAHFPDVVVRKREGAELPLFLGLAGGSQVVGLTRSLEGETWHYLIHGPDGALFDSGTWTSGQEHKALLPAEAPAGDYRLMVAHPSAQSDLGLMMPLSPPGTPEIMVFGADERIAAGNHREAQFWFMVPEGLDAFDIEIAAVRPRNARFSVWDAEGALAWDLLTERDIVQTRAEIAVPPGQDGRLWRITAPVLGFEFRMDPRIPPHYATEAGRWFGPAPADAP